MFEFASMTEGSGRASSMPRSSIFSTESTRAAADEIFLEGQRRAALEFNEGAYAVVAHRQDARFDAEALRRVRRDVAQPLARAQPFGAIEMRREVAIAEIEPGLAVEAPKRVECVESSRRRGPSRCPRLITPASV